MILCSAEAQFAMSKIATLAPFPISLPLRFSFTNFELNILTWSSEREILFDEVSSHVLSIERSNSGSHPSISESIRGVS